MRKLLLACVAAVGFTGAASAANMEAPMNKPAVEPGKVVVRLDAQVLFIAGVGTGDGNKVAGNKNQGYGFDGNMRLYPSMNAMTTNGIKYGAAVEIRTNSKGAPVGGASGNSTAQTFYIRRAYGYVGTDQLGTIRFGQIDGAIGLLKVGDNQGFGDGGINGDVPAFVAAGGSPWNFPFSVGNEYAISKFTYLSPSFAGFDFGVSFAPSTQALLGGYSAAGPGAPALGTSTVADARPRNIIELNARYRGTFSGVGLAANVGYVTSGKIDGAANVANRGLNIIDAGLTASYMGATVGGHLSTGRFNGQMALAKAGDKDALVWIVGALYENGPYTIGAHYYHGNRPGTAAAGAMIDSAFAAGANWDWAPGAQAFVEVMTLEEKEAGVKTNSTGFIVAQKFRW